MSTGPIIDDLSLDLRSGLPDALRVLLAAKEPRIARGFEILDRDHHAIDGHLAGFVRSANAVLQDHVDRSALQDAAGQFYTDLLRLERVLNRHLMDEEDLIVPIFLRRGADALG